MAEEVEYLLRLQGIGLILPYVYASNLYLEISQALSIFEAIRIVHSVITTGPQSILSANFRGKKNTDLIRHFNLHQCLLLYIFMHIFDIHFILIAVTFGNRTLFILKNSLLITPKTIFLTLISREGKHTTCCNMCLSLSAISLLWSSTSSSRYAYNTTNAIQLKTFYTQSFLPSSAEATGNY